MKIREMRILGLDPGLAILGFGTIVASAAQKFPAVAGTSIYSVPQSTLPSAQLVDYGVIETPARTAVGQRLCTIYEDLHSLIDQIHPDLVAIEKLFFYRMSTTIPVAQARGVLMLVLAQANLPYVEFTPAQVKQALTGYGNADKYEVQQAVTRELHLDSIPKPDDAADALAVALTAWFHCGDR